MKYINAPYLKSTVTFVRLSRFSYLLPLTNMLMVCGAGKDLYIPTQGARWPFTMTFAQCY